MSERMQWSEAEAVVRAYRAEQGASNEIDVALRAQALGTDTGEVRRLAGRSRRFVDRSGILSAGIALAVAAGVILVAGPSLVSKNPLLASLRPPVEPALSIEIPTPPEMPTIVNRPQFIYPSHEVRVLRFRATPPENRSM